MKRIVIFLLVILPSVAFSQGQQKKQIDWIPLKKAKEYSEKYKKNILVFFYKKDCEYCDKMKKQALSDMQVINLINNNFFPVQIDSRTKDTIYYNGKKYSNQQPSDHGYTFRHDFYAEVASEREFLTTPSIVLFNNKFEKIKTFPGIQPKQLVLRNLKPYVK